MSKPTLRIFNAAAAVQARHRTGMSQAEVARAVGTSLSSVKAWEVGNRQPDALAIELLAAILGTSISELSSTPPDLETADLATIRRAQRLTLADIAARVGQSIRTVQRVEDGTRLPDNADLWAEAYHISTANLAEAWRRSGV